MAKYRTRFSHPDQDEVAFEISDAAGLSADWLIDYLHSEVSEGKRFCEGQNVQIGWMVLKLKRTAERELELWEPNFDGMPIIWRRGLDGTLSNLIVQRSICDLMQCDPDFPSIMHPGIVSVGFSDSRAAFQILRIEPSETDTGWTFASLNEPSDEAEFQSLYQISLGCVEIIPFLALPAHAQVTKNNGEIEIILGDRRETSQSNQLLRQIAAQTRAL